LVNNRRLYKVKGGGKKRGREEEVVVFDTKQISRHKETNCVNPTISGQMDKIYLSIVIKDEKVYPYMTYERENVIENNFKFHYGHNPNQNSDKLSWWISPNQFEYKHDTYHEWYYSESNGTYYKLDPDKYNIDCVSISVHTLLTIVAELYYGYRKYGDDITLKEEVRNLIKSENLKPLIPYQPFDYDPTKLDHDPDPDLFSKVVELLTIIPENMRRFLPVPQLTTKDDWGDKVELNNFNYYIKQLQLENINLASYNKGFSIFENNNNKKKK
jgi:hypothetical protein